MWEFLGGQVVEKEETRTTSQNNLSLKFRVFPYISVNSKIMTHWIQVISLRLSCLCNCKLMSVFRCCCHGQSIKSRIQTLCTCTLAIRIKNPFFYFDRCYEFWYWLNFWLACFNFRCVFAVTKQHNISVLYQQTGVRFFLMAKSYAEELLDNLESEKRGKNILFNYLTFSYCFYLLNRNKRTHMR